MSRPRNSKGALFGLKDFIRERGIRAYSGS